MLGPGSYFPPRTSGACAVAKFASELKVSTGVMHMQDRRGGQRRVAHVLPDLGKLALAVASGAVAYPFTDPSPIHTDPSSGSALERNAKTPHQVE